MLFTNLYTEATLKFLKLNTQAQQREAVVQGRSLSPYRLRYRKFCGQQKTRSPSRLSSMSFALYSSRYEIQFLFFLTGFTG
ncbi:MAG: hypothetical protein LBJ00_17515 [Planctomycetaceae bacterium]|nr:hypothetical protein [Planctomycetaceae bacterium]